MEHLPEPTPPREFLQASFASGGHELFTLQAPAFDVRCGTSGFESHLKLVVPRDCVVGLEQEGRSFELEPGHLGVLPLSSPFRIAAASPNGRARVFQWRFSREILSRHHPHLSISRLRVLRGASSSERMLTKLVDCLAEDFAELSTNQTKTTLSTLVEALGLLEPDLPPAPDDERLRLALNHIQLHLHCPELTPQKVAEAQGVSRRYLDAVFKRRGRQSMSTTIRTVRLERAATLLRSDSEICILPLALSLGFENASHFARRFKQHFGTSPSAYRKR